MKYLGLGRETVTPEGQLQFSPVHTWNGLVSLDEPLHWAATSDGEMAVTARTQDVIDARDDLEPCGTSIPDPDRVSSVPTVVFKSVEGINPGTVVGFIISRELLDEKMMYVLELERVYNRFPEITRGRPGHRF